MADQFYDELMLTKICRVCLRSDSYLRPVEDSIVPKFDSPPVAVIEQWRLFNEIMISKDGEFPKNICATCFEEIQNTYTLLLKCEKADVILKQIRQIHYYLAENLSTKNSNGETTIGNPSNYESVNSCDIRSEVLTQTAVDVDYEKILSRALKIPSLDVIKIEDDDTNSGSNLEVDIIGMDQDDIKEEVDDVSSEIFEHKLQTNDILIRKEKIFLNDHDVSNILKNRKTYFCPRCSYTCLKSINLQRHIFRRHIENKAESENDGNSDAQDSQSEELNLPSFDSETENNDFVLTPLSSNSVPTTDISKSDSPISADSLDDQKHQKQIAHFIKYINRDGKVIKVWECGICSRNFQHHYTLLRHLPTHTNVRNFVCNECGKAFRQLSTLSQHRAIHSVERPYACETCNKSFNRISTLISHRKTHSDVKPFRCHMCHKGFHQKGNLRNHIYIHTNERPYRCTVCNKGFNQMSNLVCHSQKSHSSEFGAIWTCNRCNMSFSKRTLLRAHELETHHIPGTSIKSSRSKLVSGARKAIMSSSSSNSSTVDDSKSVESDGGISENCKSEISENGILIPAIETEAMKIARINNEMPFAVLHFFEGPPILLRIVDYGNQSFLRPTKNEDFISLKSQQTSGQTEKVSVPIVAAVYQTLNVSGRPEFNVMPPKNIYKFINHHQTISLNCEDNNDQQQPFEQRNEDAGNEIEEIPTFALTPPQIPSDLGNIIENLETPLFESLNSVKNEPVKMEDDVIDFLPDSSVGSEHRAIAIPEAELDWWQKQVLINPYDEYDDAFAEAFQNIATGSLLAPRKITESDIMPDQNASLLDISQATNPLLSQGQQFLPSLYDSFNTSNFYNYNGSSSVNESDFSNMTNILSSFRQEGIDPNVVNKLLSENPNLLDDLNECLSELLPN